MGPSSAMTCRRKTSAPPQLSRPTLRSTWPSISPAATSRRLPAYLTSTAHTGPSSASISTSGQSASSSSFRVSSTSQTLFPCAVAAAVSAVALLLLLVCLKELVCVGADVLCFGEDVGSSVGASGLLASSLLRLPCFPSFSFLSSFFPLLFDVFAASTFTPSSSFPPPPPRSFVCRLKICTDPSHPETSRTCRMLPSLLMLESG
mmetsp:Transcript_21187/g.50129  ORF Transcript_21187/g.50129 Transcript_21187/m.50129 type:complete len:204 (-) Transcript_21187:670-1281(-)